MTRSLLDPEQSPLFEEAEVLYPLAHLLVGPDKADDLVLHVFERAAECPSSERPEDLRGWLLGLLLETGREEPSFSKNRSFPEPETQTTRPLQQKVAQDLVEKAGPAALAACSPQERFLVALGAMKTSTEFKGDAMAATLSSSPEDIQSLRSQAYASLRTHLEEALAPTEQKVVEETLTDEALHSTIHKVLMDRLPSAPRALRSRIQSLLMAARRPEEPPTETSSSSGDESLSFLDNIPLGRRAGLLVSLIALGLLAGLYGKSYFFPPSSSPQEKPGLVAFSAQRAGSFSPARSTHDPDEVKAYLQRRWNRRLSIPTIDGARLQGVAGFRATATIDIPVLLYADKTTNSRVAVFAYSYALLDQLEERTTLSPSLRQKLTRSRHLVAPADSLAQGALWRDRDDVFVAVAPSKEFGDLQTRLRP